MSKIPEILNLLDEQQKIIQQIGKTLGEQVNEDMTRAADNANLMVFHTVMVKGIEALYSQMKCLNSALQTQGVPSRTDKMVAELLNQITELVKLCDDYESPSEYSGKEEDPF